jgi:Cu/Ag efflux protein CusF
MGRNLAFAAIFAVAFLTHGLAQAHRHSLADPVEKHAAQVSEAPTLEGVVKKVNRYTGRVTLFLGPQPKGASSVMAAYRVKDEAWLEQIRVGQRIRFVPSHEGGGKTIERFEIVECTALLCD